MTRARLVAAGVAAAVALLALVAVGRWERGDRADGQIRKMLEVRREIGPLDSPSLRAYRLMGDFDCLLYQRGKNPFAVELCVDFDGRVIETIDRRHREPRIGSLRDDPTRSTIRVDRALVERLLERMGVPRRQIRARREQA